MRRWIYPLLVLGCGFAQPALAYDSSWFRSDTWSGEYPNGFTMLADKSIAIRAEPDPAAPSNVTCDLKKNATYHPWNESRSRSDELKFVSFSKIAPYEMTKAYTAAVTRESDQAEVRLKLKKGARWNYLVYGAEGSFLMEYGGVRYFADQDLAEKARSLDPSADEVKPDEWLGLVCANGSKGWLLMREIPEGSGFGSPNIKEYGAAEDAP